MFLTIAIHVSWTTMQLQAERARAGESKLLSIHAVDIFRLPGKGKKKEEGRPVQHPAKQKQSMPRAAILVHFPS